MKRRISPLNRIRLSTFVLSVIFLITFQHEFLFYPADYLIDNQGDGLKTYAVASYQIADTATPLFHFRGMNYPFGENLNFTDGEPLLVMAGRVLQREGLPVDKYIIPIMHLLMLLGLPLGVMVLLEVFFESGVRNYLALIFAMSMGYTAPQIGRITTHFSLAYVFILPLAWLLYQKLIKSNKPWKWYIFIILLNIGAGLIHLYYSGVLALLLMVLILAKGRANWKQKIFRSGILSILPVVLIKFILTGTGDNFQDRVDMPYGAFGQDYGSRPENVFFPSFNSQWNWVIDLGLIARGSWEGDAFIGFGAWIMFFLLIYVSVWRKWKSNRRRFGPISRGMVYFYACVAIFIVTIGTFYFYVPEDIRMQAPSFIKNFRAVGRLAWLVYYIILINLFVFFAAWIRLRKWQGKKGWIVILLIVTGLFTFDAIDRAEYLLKHTAAQEKRVDKLDRSGKILATGLPADKYQAVMVLPYYHFSTEESGSRIPFQNFSLIGFDFMKATMLPLTDMNSTRGSTGQARMQMDLYYDKNPQICSMYPNHKPFLILTSNAGKTAIENDATDNAAFYPKEKLFIKRSHLLKVSGDYLLYELPFDSLCKP